MRSITNRGVRLTALDLKPLSLLPKCTFTSARIAPIRPSPLGIRNVLPRPSALLMAPRRSAGGFTLIELMIAVVVVALLAAVVYPSTMNSVRKARRADATDGATAVLQAQERWRSSNAAYTATMSDLGVATTTGNGYYTMALSSATAGGYTLSFTPVSGRSQVGDSGCTSMSVAVASGAPTFSPASCWSR